MRHRCPLLAATAIVAACASGPSSAAAQEGYAPAEPEPPGTRPGLFRLGPFYLTPKLHIGTLGLDTNVFYTATDRRTDFTASGGPGLEIVLPMRLLRLTVEGGANYVYFARTASQRKLGGDGKGRLGWARGRVRGGVEEEYLRTFQRPSLEVDRRLLQDRWTSRVDLALRTPHFGIRTALSRERNEVPPDQEFLGTDLRRTLDREQRRALLGLEYRLSAKTSLIVEGDYQEDRFTFEDARDADSDRVYAGFEIDSTTRLSGRAVGGVRLFRPRNLPGVPDQQVPYADASLTYRFGPRTFMSARYGRDLAYSAFDIVGASPTLTSEIYEARLEKGLWGRLDLQGFGRLTRLTTSGAITIVREPGNAVTAVRDDKVREGGADLGYRFRNRIRIGIAAVYTQRRSTFADFGIQGLLVGGTVTYTP